MKKTTSFALLTAAMALLMVASPVFAAGSARPTHQPAAPDGPPGLPFTEDFSDTTLQDPALTNANWSTEEQALFLDWRRKQFGAFGSDTTGSNISNDVQSTRAVALGDVDGDGDLDLVAGNDSGANRLYLNNGTGTSWTGSNISNDIGATRSVALGDVDDDGDLDLVAGNYTQLNRLYRRVLYHTAHGRAGSLRVDTEISNITNATLTATASLPLGENGRAPVGNTRVTYYLSNNGGARWFQVRSGVNFIFPTVGADLRWRADLGSLSPVRTPRVDQIEIDQTPLAVTLADFSAQAQPGQVLVTWETVSELNNQGFNLYRNTAPDPVGSLLAYVPSQAPGSAQGYAYSYVDGDVQPGQTYWYWLEDIDFSGATTLHGPVSVTTQTPTAVRLGELEAGGTTAPTPGWIPALLAALLVFSVAAWDMRRRTRPPNPDNGRA